MVKTNLLAFSLFFLCACRGHEADLIELAREAGQEAIALDFEHARKIEIFMRSYTYHNLNHGYDFQIRLSWSDLNGAAYWMDGLLKVDDKRQMLDWEERNASHNLLEYRRFLQVQWPAGMHSPARKPR